MRLLGLNCSVSQSCISRINILANIEKGIKKLPDDIASIIRSKVVAVLNKKNRSIPNLSFKAAVLNWGARRDFLGCELFFPNCSLIYVTSDHNADFTNRSIRFIHVL